MSSTLFGENSTINIIDYQDKDKKQIIMKYKNLDSDFNLISIKSRFTLQKINSLMEDIKDVKDDDIDIDVLNDPKNDEYKNEILKRKMIQYYCCNKNDKKSYIPPSEKVVKRIRQFKKWQKYEIFQNEGIKNYLNNLMPDYRKVKRTKKSIDDKINIYSKINVKSNNDNNSIYTMLPKISYNYPKTEKNKDKINNDIFMDKNNSVYKYKYNMLNNINQRRYMKNSSMGDILHNNFSLSNINQNSLIQKKNQKKGNANPHNKRNNSQINNINKNSSLIEYNKEMKSFEDSVFCLNKPMVPIPIEKSIRTTPGGGLLHINSILRNKNINNLVPYYSPNNVMEKLKNYKRQRNKVLDNKDYVFHINNIFITNDGKNYLDDYEFQVF